MLGRMYYRVMFFCLILLFVGTPSVLVGTAGTAKEEWNEYKSRHFFIYYKKTRLDFVRTVEDSAENYYEEITRDLGFTRYEGWSFDERAKIYIFDDQQDYIISARQAGWSQGVAETRHKIIRTFPSAAGFFDTILPHELAHIIFREFVGYESQIPLWFEEGVAMNQEKAKRWGSHQDVKRAISEKRFIPLPDLRRVKLTKDTPKETVELFYAEAASIVYYMISELGQNRFSRLCKELKEGKTFVQALQSAYYNIESLEDLNRMWLKYLND